MEHHNPWWEGGRHPKYEEWRESAIRWIPRAVEEFGSEPFSLNFVVGPRQVGKTTAIMVYIHDFLLKRVRPEAVFYYSCDEVSDFRELGEIIDNYISFREARGVRTSYIFLDEITFVDEWWRAVKSKIDRGFFRRDVVFISGSASIELMAGRERFPGRRGKGKDVFVLPLSFSEFARDVLRIPAVASDLEGVDRTMEANAILADRLADAFRTYLRTGGFPLAVKEFLQSGRIARSYHDYIAWIASDIVKMGRSTKVAKDVLSVIIRARCVPLSWNEIRKEAGLGSPNTAREYVEMLENLFVLKVLSWVGPDGRVVRRKNRKIHITDPFLYDAIGRWVGEEVYEEQKVESLVACHLNRVAEAHYWRNATEVDVVVRIGGELAGFEVKWGARKPGRRPFRTRVLARDDIPIFLASVDWPRMWH